MSSFDNPLEPQPRDARVPPSGPPAVAAAVEELPERRFWGLLDALPVILFLLLLAGLSMVHTPDQPERPINIGALLLVQSVFYGIILFYIYSIVSLKQKLPFWRGLGWMSSETGRGRRLFLFAGVLLAIWVQLLRLPMTKELPIERLFNTREAAFMLAAFGILVAPLVEEIIFRGFIFGAMERAWGVPFAVFATAVLFASIHVPQLRGGGPQMLVILVVGLVLSWVRGRTGSLAPPYFIHLAYNTTLFVMLYLATQGFRRLPGQ